MAGAGRNRGAALFDERSKIELHVQSQSPHSSLPPVHHSSKKKISSTCSPRNRDIFIASSRVGLYQMWDDSRYTLREAAQGFGDVLCQLKLTRIPRQDSQASLELSFSMAMIVCRVTPNSLARSSWRSPACFLNSFTLFFVVFTLLSNQEGLTFLFFKRKIHRLIRILIF